jgi:hypothetical protein
MNALHQFADLRSAEKIYPRCAGELLRPFWEAIESGLLESGSLGGFTAGDAGYGLHRFTLRGASDRNATVRLGFFSTILRRHRGMLSVANDI